MTALSAMLSATPAFAESGGAAAHAESCPEISRAGFTGAVVGSEPLDLLTEVPATVRTLFFFTEVLGATGMTLQHRWQNGDSDVTVPLRIGSPGWRTWSSRQIVDNTMDWRVTVTTDNGCTLGVWTIAGNPDAARPPAAAPTRSTPVRSSPTRATRTAETALRTEEINALLAEQDLIGARMLLEAEAERGVAPQLLARIRQVDLELASARREIEAERLYTAATRLAQLSERDDLSDQERASITGLQREITQRTADLENEYVYWLAAWRHTVNQGLAGGALCTNPSAFAEDWPTRITEALSWVDRQATATGYDFLLIDTRTGRSHVLPLHCPLQHSGVSAVIRQ
ncbi:DUF2914 domain-containing protein [Alcanivorax sp. JB21]|uniref:DUF2914 domain-containing protein n=1 Tax=Alcanivorax limicola TaxID=2874102 RepID=UPI001CBE90ED|nr:DUF2914 domain-containing protein [Alcanivorax limicola]MBZ2187791.1 DUF2914 domain-containing protein [Alcanivorax limicola]